MPVFTNILAIAFGNGKWSAPLSSGNALQSPDGVTYTQYSPGLGAPIETLAFGAGVFCGTTSQGMGTSPDGITWTLRTPVAGFTTFLSEGPICWDGAQFVACMIGVGGDGLWHVFTSPDGITWTDKGALTGGAIGGGQSPTAIIFALGKYFLGLGNGEQRSSATIAGLLTAADATISASFTGNQVTGYAIGNGRLVAVGFQNATASSPDGTTWTDEASQFPAFTNIRGICYDPHNSLFVAVGDGGSLSTRLNT